MKVSSRSYPAARLVDLAAVRELVETSALAAGGDPDMVADLVLAVNEAVCNIITHGYQDEPGPVEVSIEQMERDLLVRLRDAAPPFDPTSVPTPDVTLPLELRRLGGMGVHMMREFTDDLSYGQTADGFNELVMRKRNAVVNSVPAEQA